MDSYTKFVARYVDNNFKDEFFVNASKTINISVLKSFRLYGKTLIVLVTQSYVVIVGC